MSAFEFVLVSFAIILGFGISEILAGWGEQVRARHRLAPFALQIASSAFLLYFSLQFLWGLWLIRGVAWTFPLYLLVAAPALALALAAHITRVDTSFDVAPVREQYFRNSRAVYSLFAMFPIFVIIMSFIPAFRETALDPPNLVAITMIRLVAFALFASLAWSKNEKYHWAALGLLWTIAIGLMMRLLAYSVVDRAA